MAAQLQNLDTKIERLNAHKEQINDAVQKFEDTGVVDDILIPSCGKLISTQRQKFAQEHLSAKEAEIAKAEESVASKLDDWDVDESSADDEFVYITIKQRRAVQPEQPSREDVVEKVRVAFAAYSKNFKNRVPNGRIVPIKRGAP